MAQGGNNQPYAPDRNNPYIGSSPGPYAPDRNHPYIGSSPGPYAPDLGNPYHESTPQTYTPGQYGNFALANSMNRPPSPGLMGNNAGRGTQTGPWNGMDRQILSGSGSLDFTPAMLGAGGLNFNMTGIGQGANPQNQFKGWITDAQGNVVAGDPNNPMAGLGKFNAANLDPNGQYKFNYAGAPGQQFALSGNKAQQAYNTNTAPLMQFLAQRRGM